MGTDIHGIIETKRKNGEWEFFDDILDNRNYTTFAVLAGVRNGVGFAGVRRHSPVEPIAPDRGLPEGVKNTDWVYGDHSFTHMTMREILAYNWEQRIIETGVMSEKDYKHFKKFEHVCPRPRNWSGGISGGDTLVVPESEYEENNPLYKGHTVYVQAEWPTPLHDACSDFMAWCFRMLSFQDNPEMDDIRIVIGFDS